MNNIVFGAYNGYNSLKTEKGGIFYFLKSLRKYNKNCKVVIVCEKHLIFSELVDFCNEMNCEIYTDFNLEYYMMLYRFEIYKKYLDSTSEKFDKILLSDLNDVIFQEDPFSIDFTEDIYCALEQNILSDRSNHSSNLNMDCIYECTNPVIVNNYDNYEGKYVICAGTILGTYTGIQKYLDFYKSVEKLQMINDQGVLNIYVYNYLKSKKVIEYTESKILTLDRVSFDSLTLSDDRSILNKNNEKYAILHQINRCNLEYMLSLV